MSFKPKKKKLNFHHFSKNILRKNINNKKITINIAIILTSIIILLLINTSIAMAEPDQSALNDYLNEGNNTTDIVRLLVVLTLLTLIPAIVITMTAFPRIVIVLSFTRNAMGTQNMPPNQILIGIALILSFFIMSPVFSQVKTEAYDPYMAGEIDTEQAYTVAMEPMREFMFKQARTEPNSINFFLELYGLEEEPKTLDDVPTVVLLMAYITSELKKAFTIGFILYIPFIVVDMIVASVLMAMGMMMMPPAMISLPFKVLLFILVDGWTLLFKTLVLSFA